MNDFYRHARRASTGKTALDALAGVFLLCSIAFWGVLHWQVLVTPGTGLPQMIVAGVMTLIYSLALPVLLSALIPSTPAGQLLQKTQWATIGFWVIIPSVAFLLWHAYNLMSAWFEAQQVIYDAGLVRAYTISALIAFVVIVALAWTQVTPERWLREVEQAHQVRKLEMMQRGELAIVKARLLWAEQKAAIGYARLLPAEQQEVRDTLRGLLMGIADTQRSIARTMGISGELEREIMGDAEIGDALAYVSQQLEKPARTIDKALTYFDDTSRESHAATGETHQLAHVNTRPQSSMSREAESGTVRHSRTQPDDAAHVLDTIRNVLPRVFTAQDVAEQMRWQDKRPAQRVIRAWLDSGDAEEVRLGRYSLT